MRRRIHRPSDRGEVNPLAGHGGGWCVVYWGERLIRLLAPDPNVYYIGIKPRKDLLVTTAVT
jgi:hypothetical protein